MPLFCCAYCCFAEEDTRCCVRISSFNSAVILAFFASFTCGEAFAPVLVNIYLAMRRLRDVINI